MKKLTGFLCAMALVFGVAGTANSELWDRGGGLIYDDVLDITWLQDANYAGTTMNWADAVAWADQLIYGGFDDWRLPTTVDGPLVLGYDGTTTGGYNITTSEMGYMYYNLGNLALQGVDGSIQSGWGLDNVGPFLNLNNSVYWSGTDYASVNLQAWGFSFNNGRQAPNVNIIGQTAWAVRDGDCSGVIPIPPAVWLFVSGLIGVLGFRKRLWK